MKYQLFFLTNVKKTKDYDGGEHNNKIYMEHIITKLQFDDNDIFLINQIKN